MTSRIDRSPLDHLAALSRENPAQSGTLLLADGRDAFAARLQLIDAARHRVDCQYYIWRNDLSGALLLDALRRATRRGVRVRLLLDDHNTAGLDSILAACAALENLEVRVFNPHKIRGWRLVGLMMDFARLNRRMHNKSLTVDGIATIVGGRNVGDEYFGAHPELSFIDLDVLAVGDVAVKVASDFQRYWVSRSAVPVERMIPRATRSSLDAVRQAAAALVGSPEGRAYSAEIADRQWVRDFRDGTLPLEWVRVRLVSDVPSKGLGLVGRRKLLMRRLRQILGPAQEELLLISAYFVPTWHGMRMLRGLARRGVRITVLTNSLEATDVAAVHAGYARHRKALLKAGVSLYEMKRLAAAPKGRKAGDSSASSLHAKAFGVDQARVFIGSLNFDARSVRWNTEMGLVIDSRKLAQFLAADVATERFRRQAYEVRLAPSGRLEWVERTAAGERVHTSEPHASLPLRFAVAALALLRIDWLL